MRARTLVCFIDRDDVVHHVGEELDLPAERISALEKRGIVEKVVKARKKKAEAPEKAPEE